MRKTWIVVGMTLVVASTAAAQQHTDPGLQPVPPVPVVNEFKNLGSLTFYTDRGTFQAAWPGLETEDFTGTSVPNGGSATCSPPLNSATNDLCFSTGSVVDGFSLEIFVDDGANEYVVLNNAFVPCVAVGPNFFVDETDWTFAPAVAAAGFDVYAPFNPGSSYSIEIFGSGGSLGSTNLVASGAVAVFFGVDTSDPGGITRIEVREAVDGQGELFCDLEFGATPVPVTLQSVELE